MAEPQGHSIPLIAIVPLGMALGILFLVSYVLCFLFFVWFRHIGLAHTVLALVRPYFEAITWEDALIGAFESFWYGWYVALIFGPLYNFFAPRLRPRGGAQGSST